MQLKRILFVLAVFGCGYAIHALFGMDEPRFQRGEADKHFKQDQSELDRSNAERLVSHADVLEGPIQAVVSVYPSKIVRVGASRGGGVSPLEEMLRRYGFNVPQRPTTPVPDGEDYEERRMPQGIGSGVIVSSDGYIITNHHVITDSYGKVADEIEVAMTDGSRMDASIIGSDPKTDIAILKVEGEELPFIPMANSDNLRVGDIVFAVGNPLSVGLTVTKGIVSATRRSNLNILERQAGYEAYENFIQTDASINPGNSGGAMLDAEGRLVGINSAIISGTGGNIGIGFAIPINLARDILIDLVETGSVRRGLLGVEISNLDPTMAEAFGLQSTQGALVQNVREGLPAAQAGIQKGDVIVALDEVAVRDTSSLRLRVAASDPGTEVDVKIIRNGEEMVIPVVLGDLEDPTAFVGRAARDTGKDILTGVTVRVLNDELRAEFEVPEDVKGIVVTDVRGRSPYASSLRLGMVIIEVDDTKVSTIANFSEAVESSGDNVIKMWVYDSRRGSKGFVALRLEE